MKHAILSAHPDRAEIYETINRLRDKRSRALIPSTRDEIGRDIDECLDLLHVPDAATG